MTELTVVPRQRIVEALAYVVARDGYAESKIQDIVKEARVSFRTFYEQFPNKEAALVELHGSVIDAVIGTVEGAVVFDRPWKEVMRKAFTAYFELLTAQPRLTHAFLVELATLSEPARRSREMAMERFTTMLVGLVEAGRAANPDIPSRPITPLTARALLGGVLELVTSRALGNAFGDLTDLADTATDMLWTITTSTGA